MNYQLEVCLVALTLITRVTPSVAAQSQQAMQKGISVELPVTKNAVTMPDADQGDAVIVSVTDGGGLYLGVNPISPVALAETVKRVWPTGPRRSSTLRRTLALRMPTC